MMQTLHTPRPRARRRWLNLAMALLVVAALLWTSAAAFAQSGLSFSLGCWAVTSGGGGQASSVQFRTVSNLSWSGGEPQSSNFRIRNNQQALFMAVNPPPSNTPGPVPPADGIFLPVIWGPGLILSSLCS